MKILYITPTINTEGGLERVLSIKTNYFIERFGYQIEVITCNNGFQNSFFNFNSKIKFHDILLNSNKLGNLINYKVKIQKLINLINPDCIVICDFGLKGFSFPILFNNKVPIVFEAHGSIYNESQYYKVNFFSRNARKLKYEYKKFCSKKFDHFVVLSNESLKEWPVVNYEIIPNPNMGSDLISDLTAKNVILIARHSHEKGLDFALKIWEKVGQTHPDWTLSIFGKKDEQNTYINLAKQLQIESKVKFYEPVKEIQTKYCEASISIMTSRSEGFPMALIEAMSCGLPVVAFDCPIGPRSIITNEEDGFLIETFNCDAFASRIIQLIENESLRKEIGLQAKKSVSKYDIDKVMLQWNAFFEKITSR